MRVGMFSSKLHHVGIVVANEERLVKLMGLLGVKPGRRQYVPEYEADCVFGEGACSMIEFIIPRGGKLAKFNNGVGGLHHIALEVDDLAQSSGELRRLGVELLEAEGIDAGPIKINFLPPIYTRGLIVEFVERSK